MKKYKNILSVLDFLSFKLLDSVIFQNLFCEWFLRVLMQKWLFDIYILFVHCYENSYYDVYHWVFI